MSATVPTALRSPSSRSAMRTAGRLVAAAVVLLLVMVLLGALITKVVAHSSLGAADARMDADLVRHRTPTLNRITHAATYLAETTTISILAAALVVVLRLTLRRWRESIFIGVAVAGEVAIFLVVTLAIHRHRPAVPELDSAPPTSSFPSGHTAAAVALYGGLAVAAWRSPHRPSAMRSLLRAGATLLAILIPIGVGFSRIYRGMHYPTDVLGGALLSVCWLSAAAALLLPRADHGDP